MLQSGMTGYGQLTVVQRKRDEDVIDEIRRNYIEPTLSILEAHYPDYLTMSDHDKFKALMLLNESHAPKGEYLLLDFGDCTACNGNDLMGCRMSSAVFTGISWARKDPPSNSECPNTFKPMFRPIGYNVDHWDGGTGSVAFYLEQHRLDPFYLDEDELEDDADFDMLDFASDLMTLGQFPIPFRIALIANLIRQSVICTYVAACRFAAGIDDKLELCQYYVNPLITGDSYGEYYGWNIVIREAKPKNDPYMHDISRTLQKAVAEETTYVKQANKLRSKLLGTNYDFFQSRFQSSPRGKYASTRVLEDFLFRLLPSKGLHIGRKGEGKPLSWAAAHTLFLEEYGCDTYRSMESFQSRCYALMKAHRRKVD